MPRGSEYPLSIKEDISGGMSLRIAARLLPANRFRFGENILVRRGLIDTAPAFETSVTGYSVPAGKYQGSFEYKAGGVIRLVTVVDGNVYVFNRTTQATSLVSSGQLSATARQAHFAQCDKYCVIQDSEEPATWAEKAWPVILDGDAEYDQSALRGTNPEHAFPKGTVMAYGQFRPFVAVRFVYENADWRDVEPGAFVAGSGLIPWRPESVLDWSTESTYWNGGGAIMAPYGGIRSMTFQSGVQSGSGEGPLLVLCEDGAMS